MEEYIYKYICSPVGRIENEFCLWCFSQKVQLNSSTILFNWFLLFFVFFVFYFQYSLLLAYIWFPLFLSSKLLLRYVKYRLGIKMYYSHLCSTHQTQFWYQLLIMVVFASKLVNSPFPCYVRAYFRMWFVFLFSKSAVYMLVLWVYILGSNFDHLTRFARYNFYLLSC